MNKKLILRGVFSSVPKVKPDNLKPEDSICVKFANMLREMQLIGDTRKDFCWTHVANEFAGKSRPIFGGIQKGMGKVSGWPDHIFMWDDGCGAIEFKAGKNKLSAKQEDVKDWFIMCNVDYRVCYSEGEAFEVLEEWGLI